MIEWTWFDVHWSWLGLAMSAVLMPTLFFTDVFRSDRAISRWRDPVWLAWLAPAAYMLHQFEEYGISAAGVHFAFPDVLCASVHMPPYPACGLPEPVFVAINIPMIWIAGLVFAMLARRHPFVGLGLYSIHITNALSHLGVWIAGAYNPGALTALLVQLPLSLWVFHACFGAGRMPRLGIVLLFIAGAVASVVLLAAVHLFANGAITGTMLVAIEAVNPLLLFATLWIFQNSLLRKTTRPGSR